MNSQVGIRDEDGPQYYGAYAFNKKRKKLRDKLEKQIEPLRETGTFQAKRGSDHSLSWNSHDDFRPWISDEEASNASVL